LASATTGTATVTASTGALRAAYQPAYDDYSKGNYALAIVGFQSYLRQYPQTALAPDAHYYLGDCYAAQGKADRALAEWEALLGKYPQSDKAVPARLRRANLLAEQGQEQDAILLLQELLRVAPGSPEAQQAQTRLKELTTAP
ncbi:MAG: tol-pal system protein YbgF, partial [bacterium]